MTEFSQSLSITASGLSAQSQRLRHLSENIANADTPGYQRKTVTFTSASGASGHDGLVAVGRVMTDGAAPKEIYDPSHPLADANGRYEGSNVNLVIELADAREAQRSYEANLKMFEQTRQMGKSLFDLLRR
ncbi:flagellar basal body rod protein FlgC [Roseovarius salis]|uniref:flagellar basal body rod protein FlgC n=1 Tax=Roseovarius salis TaxID=3376063 RepID=UPI0037C5F4F0